MTRASKDQKQILMKHIHRKSTVKKVNQNTVHCYRCENKRISLGGKSRLRRKFGLENRYYNNFIHTN